MLFNFMHDVRFVLFISFFSENKIPFVTFLNYAEIITIHFPIND